MKKIFLAILLFPLIVSAQQSVGRDGIIWTKGLSWSEVLLKAKQENKFIFVDAYATWCMPCKKMDTTVFSNNTIGNLINDVFIAVKVQMDSSKNDDVNVRLHYPTARMLEREFKVAALPYYIFFSPDGEAIHKTQGAMGVNEFSAVANDALDSAKQFFTLIKKAKLGQLPPEEMVRLANKLKVEKDKEAALEVARAYMDLHLNKLSDEELLKSMPLDFITRFIGMVKVDDRITKLIESHQDHINKTLERDQYYAIGLVQYIISKDMIDPFLPKPGDKNQNPDWKAMYRSVKKKFNKGYANYVVVGGKSRWYRYKKQNKEYVKWLVKKVDMEGDKNFKQGAQFMLNGWSWDVYLYSNNKKELSSALVWIEKALELGFPDDLLSAIIDTKASLLYKIGRKDLAVIEMSKAVNNIEKLGKTNTKYHKKLDKMRKSEPI